MDDSLLNQWWTRWAVLGIGIVITLIGWYTSDDDHRRVHVDRGLIGDRVRPESDFQAGLNRLSFMVAGVALVAIGLFWGPLKRFLTTIIS